MDDCVEGTVEGGKTVGHVDGPTKMAWQQTRISFVGGADGWVDGDLVIACGIQSGILGR